MEAISISTPPHKEAEALDKEGRPRTHILETEHVEGWA